MDINENMSYDELLILLNQLKDENTQLKLKLLHVTNNIHDEKLNGESMIEVTYNHIHEELKEDIERAIIKKAHKMVDHDNLNYTWKVRYFKNFCIDTTKSPIDINARQYIGDVPYYTKAFDGIIPYQEKKSPRKMRNCFNCNSSDHELKDCPHPINRSQVRIQRMRFQERFESNDLRFWDNQHHFQPGVLSERLKNALGMKEGEEPPYYKAMQVHGQPPAYIKPSSPIKKSKKGSKNNFNQDFIEISQDMEVDEKLIVPPKDYTPNQSDNIIDFSNSPSNISSSNTYTMNPNYNAQYYNQMIGFSPSQNYSSSNINYNYPLKYNFPSYTASVPIMNNYSPYNQNTSFFKQNQR